MAMDPERIRAAFERLDELPYGPERIDGHLALSAEAEQTTDYSLRCKLLIWLSDDYMETDDEPRMIEYFDRAWALFREHEEEIDPHVRYNLRTTFAPSVSALDLDPAVPAEQVRARLDAMEEFYRASGYSMRIPYRTRYWFHRRRGEHEEAARLVDLLAEAPGDAGAHCDAMGPMVAAQWYQGPGKDRARAAELWERILELPDQRCEEDHRAQGYAELTYLGLVLDRGDTARRCHRAGYPLIRRRRGHWRALDLHMIYANRVRDAACFLRIVHDHVEYLDLPLDDDVSWYHGRVVQFLRMLVERGHAALPVTLADRGETTARALCARLEAGLERHAAGLPEEADRELYAGRLKSWREDSLKKVDLPAEDGSDGFWESVLPPVPAPWAAPPDLEDLPRGWTPQDALLADARVLYYLDHPHSDGAWARVAALGTPRSPVDLARLTGYRAGSLIREGDRAAARQLELAKVALDEQSGRIADALVSRMVAALCAYLSGDRQIALRERDELVGHARALHEAGRLDDGELMRLLVNDFRLDSLIELTALAAGPDQMIQNPTTNEKFTAVKDLYLRDEQYYGAWADMLGAWAFQRQNLGSLYGRFGLAPGFVAETPDRVDFWYGKARDANRDAMLLPQMAEAELNRGQNLLTFDRAAAAEQAADEAARINAGLNAELLGQISLLRAEAIARLAPDGSRDAELLEAAREAAVLLAGEGEPEAAFARILVGEVHRRAGRHALALEVFDAAVCCLDEEQWGLSTPRSFLRRAAAGRVVCLRATGAPERAAALLDGLLAALPDWNRVTVAWILLDAAEAGEALGDPRQALADYTEAARIAADSDEPDPRARALERMAALTVPADAKAALARLDEAAAWIGKLMADPARPDPRKLARIARIRASRVPLLIDPDPVPDDVLERLLPDAYREASEGAGQLADLLRATHAANAQDPWLFDLLDDLEAAVGWAATVQKGLGDAAGAAARFTGLAQLVEECGLAGHAAPARENAEVMTSAAGS